MNRRWSRALLIAATLSCTKAAPTPPMSAEELALRSQVDRYYRDMSARDWKAYAAHFWPQATLTTVWQPAGEPAPRVVVTSIDGFLAQTAQGPDSKPIFEERLIDQEVRLVGTIAQVWAHYEARFGDSTSVSTWRGIDAFTWLKHDGAWRIVALAYADEGNSDRGQ